MAITFSHRFATPFLFAAVAALATTAVRAQSGDTLPGTAPWDFPRDIVGEQHAELRAFYEGRIAQAAAGRGQYWSSDDWTAAVNRNRLELRTLIGAVDSFLPPKPRITPLGATAAFTFSLVDWPILRLGNQANTAGPAGAMVREYGILLQSKRPGKHPAVVAIPDANQSAADIAGLTAKLPQREQYARSLAVNGYIVFVPFFTQRRAFSQPWSEDRDWLVRLAYQVGRHLIGSEVQQVSSAVDYLGTLAQIDAGRIGVVGSGQGGLTALYAAALDTRIKSTLVSHYFDNRDRAFEEPQDRTVWKHLQRFGDAEIAAMIAPRALLVDRGGAGVTREFARAHSLFVKAHAGSAIRYIGESDQTNGPSTAAIERFDEVLTPDVQWPISAPQTPADPEPFYAVANAQFSQWQARFRNLAMEAYAEREKRSKRPDLEQFLDMIGRYPKSTGGFEAKSIAVYDEPEFKGYRLSVRVYDGVHVYGILLVPKGMKPGERRPVVFTQHGFGGKPEDALGVVDDRGADALYAKFGRDLARRGYVVFAPMIASQLPADRNGLARRAHLTGLTPVGMESRKASRALDFLETLTFVDKDRAGYYGLSYGGFTALWAGPLEPRFKVVICSGHFNDWNLKTSDVTEGTSFPFHKDTFDMNNFGILNQFNHSDIAALIAPRAFMVEIGSRDAVEIEPRRFVELELSRVLEIYRQMGIPEKARIARFDGPHKIDGTEAFPFLDKMLVWAPPR